MLGADIGIIIICNIMIFFVVFFLVMCFKRVLSFCLVCFEGVLSFRIVFRIENIVRK